MGNKFRETYDRLYIAVETKLLALGAVRDGKKLAKTLPWTKEQSQKYREFVRPYWKQFRGRVPNKFWFRLYCTAERPFSPQYIPDNLWFGKIIPHYNNLIFAKALQDKCMHGVLFPDMKRPVTVVKRMAGVYYDDAFHILTEEEAISRVPGHGRVVVKPSVGSGQGHGIHFYDSDSLTETEIREIFRSSGPNFIMQEKLLQHASLAALNVKSLNTVRVITFLHHNNVHILTAILRVGGGDNEVDNTSQGGYKCTINPDGHLQEVGTTKINGKWEYVKCYPNGVLFEDVQIPSYDKIVHQVTEHAARMSHFRIIGWDIAVDTDGEPVLIEYNVIPAQGHATAGPLFGDLTDEVLNEVLGRK